ncbi:MAG: hypothetical protein FRX49_01648 [Trebouxia sp. A1-2]|nr:MAG: hypothetical protein FRX49_01648 [Trebouxia sp. A1-2]
MVANVLVTKNLALNKVAYVLTYLETEIASHRDQMVEEIFPLLLTFREAANGHDKAGSTEMAFAAILPQLQAAAVLLHQSTLLVVNLLSQLGALCSEQTRKSTVISGPYAHSCMSSAADGLGLLLQLDTITGRIPAVTSAAAAYSKSSNGFAERQNFPPIPFSTLWAELQHDSDLLSSGFCTSSLRHDQALAEQRVQVEGGMNSYGLEVQQASLTVLAWQAHMAALHATPRSSEALLTKQAAALVRGVDLAAGLRNRLHLLLDLHAAASVPVTQQALTLFVSSICLVKGLLSAMAAKVRAKQRHLASTAPSLLQFTSTRTAADKALKDAETATEAALQVIAGPATSEQLVMLYLCVDALKATATISSNRMQTLDSALRTLRTLIRLKAAVSQASNCSWLYFDQALLEPIFAAALKRPQDAHQLPYILAAFMDAQQLLQHAPLPLDRADAAPKVYDDHLWSTLEQVVLMPLCQRTETDLRLHHHAALLTGIPPMNPLTHDILDVNPLLEVDQLVLSTRVVDVR